MKIILLIIGFTSLFSLDIYKEIRIYNNDIENVFFWDGKNNNGNLVSSGNYYISATNNSFNKTKKILFIK